MSVKENSEKILFVMGNGPSLGEVMNDPEKLDFIKKHDTFGLNGAYRAYEKYNFYPTYFGCFDYVVNGSHKKNFEKLVLSNSSIKEFYFIGDSPLKQKLYIPEVYNNTKFKKFNFINVPVKEFPGISRNINNFINIGSSGANAAQIGVIKGYKKIVLLGCDCNYVEYVKGSQLTNTGTLQIVDNIKENPNYWFGDYQQKGDLYNVPNTGIFQMGSWFNLSKYSPRNIKIYNASKISKIPYFEKIDFQTLM